LLLGVGKGYWKVGSYETSKESSTRVREIGICVVFNQASLESRVRDS